METQGKRFGTEHNPLRTSENSEYGAKYSFPVEREEFLFVTSPFGMRQDPMDNTKQGEKGGERRGVGSVVNLVRGFPSHCGKPCLLYTSRCV